jgi:hypothetical protein
MNEQLKNAYTKVINKHFSAVKTDTECGYSDSWKLENKAKQLWEDFYNAEAEFKLLLARCVLDDN